jgi:hypothetical protein
MDIRRLNVLEELRVDRDEKKLAQNKQKWSNQVSRMEETVKETIFLTKHHAMKAYLGRGSIAPPIL